MKILVFAAIMLSAATVEVCAQRDTTSHTLDGIVVTGTRNMTDVRHLPQTISVVDRHALTENRRTNVLPTLAEQCPDCS